MFIMFHSCFKCLDVSFKCVLFCSLVLHVVIEYSYMYHHSFLSKYSFNLVYVLVAIVYK